MLPYEQSSSFGGQQSKTAGISRIVIHNLVACLLLRCQLILHLSSISFLIRELRRIDKAVFLNIITKKIEMFILGLS